MQEQQLNTNSQYNILIGAYSDGLKKAVFDSEKQEITNIEQISEVESPFYLLQNKDILYAVSIWTHKLTALRMKKEGQYETISSQVSEGEHPCYISLDDNNKHLFVANFSSGTNLICKLDQEGLIQNDEQQVLQQEQVRKSEHPRQDKAHSHSFLKVPGLNLYVSGDQGADCVFSYEYDQETGKFVPFQTIISSYISGPRHIAFNENVDTMYAVGELNSHLLIYSLDKETRKFELKREVNALTEEDKDTDKLSSHIIYRNGYIYMGNRNADTITVFKAKDDYEVEFLQSTKVGGWPWFFEFTPDNKYLITQNYKTNDMSLLRLEENNLLTFVKNIEIPIKEPSQILFIQEF